MTSTSTRLPPGLRDVVRRENLRASWSARLRPYALTVKSLRPPRPICTRPPADPHDEAFPGPRPARRVLIGTSPPDRRHAGARRPAAADPLGDRLQRRTTSRRCSSSRRGEDGRRLQHPLAERSHQLRLGPPLSRYNGEDARAPRVPASLRRRSAIALHEFLYPMARPTTPLSEGGLAWARPTSCSPNVGRDSCPRRAAAPGRRTVPLLVVLAA